MAKIEKDVLKLVFEKFLSSGNNFEDQEIFDFIEVKFKEMTKLKFISLEDLDLKFGDVIPCDKRADCWYQNNLDELHQFKGVYWRDVSKFGLCDKCIHTEKDEVYAELLSDLQNKAMIIVLEWMSK